MVEFVWHDGEKPDNLPITQVYGVLFDDGGRILLKLDDGIYGLIGGKPERGETREETLHREVYEEVNCEISDLHYLGYQTVLGDGAPYAQLRYIAKVTKMGPNRPDLDNGKTYERIYAAPDEAIKLLNYTSGDEIIDSAVKLAKQKKLF